MKERMNTTKAKVLEVLENSVLSRGSDATLIRIFYSAYFGATEVRNIEALINTGTAPSYECIMRCRRLIQASGRFLPYDKVMEKRREAEVEMREYCVN